MGFDIKWNVLIIVESNELPQSTYTCPHYDIRNSNIFAVQISLHVRMAYCTITMHIINGIVVGNVRDDSSLRIYFNRSESVRQHPRVTDYQNS